MVTTRMYKDFVGVEFGQTTFNWGSRVYFGFLLDTGTTLGTNVSMSDTSVSSPPVGVTGLVNNEPFIYITPFSGGTTIDGPITGNVVVQMTNTGTTSNYIYLNKITVDITAEYKDGTYNTISGGEVTVWDGNTDQAGGDPDYTIGVYFAFPVDEITIDQDALLCMRVRTYGYRSSNFSGGYFKLLQSKTDNDILLSLPLIEV